MTSRYNPEFHSAVKDNLRRMITQAGYVTNLTDKELVEDYFEFIAGASGDDSDWLNEKIDCGQVEKKL